MPPDSLKGWTSLGCTCRPCSSTVRDKKEIDVAVFKALPSIAFLQSTILLEGIPTILLEGMSGRGRKYLSPHLSASVTCYELLFWTELFNLDSPIFIKLFSCMKCLISGLDIECGNSPQSLFSCNRVAIWLLDYIDFQWKTYFTKILGPKYWL